MRVITHGYCQQKMDQLKEAAFTK